jgi:hypothetical protein
MQIRALRVEVRQHAGSREVRWLGLQGKKYVCLPTNWVELNFDKRLRKEAMNRALGRQSQIKIFVRVPVGDSRTDEPPPHLRDKKGRNYYFHLSLEMILDWRPIPSLQSRNRSLITPLFPSKSVKSDICSKIMFCYFRRFIYILPFLIFDYLWHIVLQLTA